MTSRNNTREQAIALVDSPRFQRCILLVIIVNAVTLGLETWPAVSDRFGNQLHALNRLVLVIFVAELVLRIYAHRLKFFRDPWSVFDFIVVAVAVVPATGKLSVLRSLRVLRALRMVALVPGMRRVVGGLLSAIPGMLSIVVLLGLVLYVGAVLATELYGATSPQYFGDLGSSLFTLFQVMTGEAWPDIAHEVLQTHPSAWIFFVAYILVSTFVVLNLFTAVVVSAMEPENKQEPAVGTDVLREIRELRAEIASMRAEHNGALVSGSGSVSGVGSGSVSGVSGVGSGPVSGSAPGPRGESAG